MSCRVSQPSSWWAPLSWLRSAPMLRRLARCQVMIVPMRATEPRTKTRLPRTQKKRLRRRPRKRSGPPWKRLARRSRLLRRRLARTRRRSLQRRTRRRRLLRRRLARRRSLQRRTSKEGQDGEVFKEGQDGEVFKEGQDGEVFKEGQDGEVCRGGSSRSSHGTWRCFSKPGACWGDVCRRRGRID